MVRWWTLSHTSANYPKMWTPPLWHHHWAPRGPWRSRHDGTRPNTTLYRPSAQRSRFKGSHREPILNLTLLTLFRCAVVVLRITFSEKKKKKTCCILTPCLQRLSCSQVTVNFDNIFDAGQLYSPFTPRERLHRFLNHFWKYPFLGAFAVDSVYWYAFTKAWFYFLFWERFWHICRILSNRIRKIPWIEEIFRKIVDRCLKTFLYLIIALSVE